MTTNVNKAFQGPSRYSTMGQGSKQNPAPSTPVQRDAYDPNKHGDFHTMFDHYEKMKADAQKPKTPIDPNRPRCDWS